MLEAVVANDLQPFTFKYLKLQINILLYFVFVIHGQLVIEEYYLTSDSAFFTVNKHAKQIYALLLYIQNEKFAEGKFNNN